MNVAEAMRLELTWVYTRCLSRAVPYRLGDASLFEDWRRVRDLNSQAPERDSFQDCALARLGLTLHEFVGRSGRI